MHNTLKHIIEKYQNDGDLIIKNQNFLSETIFENILSIIIFDQVTISNCKFE